MKTQMAPNGWPGIFIPGDEALAMASMFRAAADALEDGSVPPSATAAMLRSKAQLLSACRAERQAPRDRESVDDTTDAPARRQGQTHDAGDTGTKD